MLNIKLHTHSLIIGLNIVMLCQLINILQNRTLAKVSQKNLLIDQHSCLYIIRKLCHKPTIWTMYNILRITSYEKVKIKKILFSSHHPIDLTMLHFLESITLKIFDSSNETCLKQQCYIIDSNKVRRCWNKYDDVFDSSVAPLYFK
jgi:hypothetical protein